MCVMLLPPPSPDHAVPQLHHLGPLQPLRPGGQVVHTDLEWTQIMIICSNTDTDKVIDTNTDSVLDKAPPPGP